MDKAVEVFIDDGKVDYVSIFIEDLNKQAASVKKKTAEMYETQRESVLAARQYKDASERFSKLDNYDVYGFFQQLVILIGRQINYC